MNEQLEFLIKVGVLNLEQAQALQKTIDDTTASAVANSKAIKNLKGEEEEAGKATEFLHHNHRALHQIMHLIGHETAPELGHALGAMLMGPLGMVLAFGAAFEYVMENVKKKSEEASKVVQAVWESANKAEDEAVSRANDFATAMAKAAASSDTIEKGFASQIALLKEISAAHIVILSEMEKEEMAAAHGDKAKEEEIRARYEGAKKSEAHKTDEAEIQKMRDEENVRKNNAQYLEAERTRLDAELKDESGDKSFAEMGERLKGLDRGKLKEESEEAAKRIQNDRQNLEQQAKEHGQNSPEAASALGLVHKDKAAMDAFVQFDKDTKALAEHTEQIRQTTKAYEIAAANAEENAKAIAALTAKIRGAEQKLFSEESGKEIAEAIRITNESKSRELTPAEKAFLQTVATLISGQSQSLTTAEKMFTAAQKNQDAMTGFIERLLNSFEKMPDFKTYENRIQAIEKRIEAQR